MTTLEQIVRLTASLKAPRERDEETNALVREIEVFYEEAKIMTPEEAEAGLAFLDFSEEGDIDLNAPSVARFYRACVRCGFPIVISLIGMALLPSSPLHERPRSVWLAQVLRMRSAL